MKFELKKTKDKEETCYKTIYIKQTLVDKVNQIASDNNTSFNNVVISMIESCLNDN